MYRSEEQDLPVLAITFNHRQAAFYRADQEHSESAALQSTRNRGLKSVRMLKHNCPIYLVKELVKLHNLSHGGSGFHMWETMDHALEIEDEWAVKCNLTGLTATNASLAFMFLI